MNVALIGTGSIAHQHVRALKKVHGLSLTAVLSNDLERAQKFAQQYKIKAYVNIDDLLRDSSIQILDIVNQNYLHGDFALQGIAAKKHLIVEKPLDISVVKAREIIELAEQNDIKMTVISQYRFGKAFQKIKKDIQQGRLGTVLLAHVFLGKKRTEVYYNSARGWKKQKNLTGGGVLIFNAIHYIGILRYLLGEITDSKGVVSTLTHHIEVEDTGGMVMKFSNGALATLSASTSLSFNVPERLEIHGSKCSYIVEGRRITRIWKNNRLFSFLASFLSSFRFYSQGKLHHQIQNFVDFLQEKSSLAASGEDGLKDLEVLEKAYK